MKKRIVSLLLALLMIMSILPAHIFAEDVATGIEVGSARGKFAKVTTTAYFYVGMTPGAMEQFAGAVDFAELMVINDVTEKNGKTYYQLYAAEGASWPVSLEGGVQKLSDGVWVSAEYVDVQGLIESDSCDICGKSDCDGVHLFCPACEKFLCGKTHTYCGYCDEYDCTIDHQAEHRPATAPVIPENPTLSEGADVFIVDEYGDQVAAENGYVLSAGTKASLSAWTKLEGAVSYQWQILYDVANDLWVNIQGQNRQGILISPALVLSILEEQGSTALRCVVTAGNQTLTSAAIPVTVVEAGAMTAFAYASGRANSGVLPVADDENKVNLIVNYVFTDGKIAANPWAASLPIGDAYSTDPAITVPTIAGYTPKVGEGANSGNATLSGYQLSLSFTADELMQDRSVTIVYHPAPVKVRVNHYWQNVENDNYTLHVSETTELVTGTTVGDVHKSYPGFYKLNYEHPTVAADGSTIVDVYYDRHYYLMKFELSGGYGTDPIYARFGAPIEVDTPARPGYVFAGWSLNGKTAVDLPATVPVGNSTYQALWTPGPAVNYTIVYWKENADNTNYSYWTQQTAKAVPGTRVSGSNSVAPHVSDEQFFTYNDHLTDKDVEIEGDGSTVINVYYNRNYYTIYFKGYGTCAMDEHTHGTDCVNELICGADGHTHNADCKRTLVCNLEQHEHTADCLVCTKEIHPSHNLETCYKLDCNIKSHVHENEHCVVECKHVHVLGCYTSENGLRATEKPDGELTHLGNGIYTRKQSGVTRYYLNIGNNWYRDDDSRRNPITLNCTHIIHDDSCYTCGKAQVSHTHTIEDGCYTQTCEKEIHAAHTDADNCYKDTAHAHDETCYEYQCGKEPHEHNDACYRDCYKPEHTHDGNCSKKDNGNNNRNVIYVITAKYEQNVDHIWPTYDRLKNGNHAHKDSDGNVENKNGNRFRGWDVDNIDEETISKRVTMTEDLCDPSDGEKNATALYGASYFYKLYYMFESFDQTSAANGNDRKYYDSTVNNVPAKYYDSSATFYQELYYSSDTTFNQKQITGMNPVGREKQTAGSGNNYVISNFLYYTRNRWTLSFHNVSKVVKTQANIMFEQPLVNYKDSDDNLLSTFVPDYPTDSYEEGTMEFEGWYTTPECFEGTKVDFSTLTMPNNNLTLYAHWVPVSRTVRFFLDEQDLRLGVTIPDRMKQVYAASHNGAVDSNSPYQKFTTRNDVPNKSYLTNVSTPGVSEGYEGHPYKGYTFVGWFYRDNGEEKAFDPDNMPVTHDLNLYGKWSSDVLCPYEIRFLLDANGDGKADLDKDNNVIYVADSVTGSTLAGNSRTFSAKGDTALYAGYQTGYYPNVASHTIDFKASDVGGKGFDFLYTPGEPVEYIVKYLEKGTDKVLAPQESYPYNTKAVVTENFKSINGYMPDAYQKTLVVVRGGDNEIIFWYTKDTEHALYQVNHYIQNLDGNGWTEYRSATFTGEIGKLYSASPETITGFTFSDDRTNQYNVTDKINAYTNTELPGAVSFNSATDTVSGTLTGAGMQLNLYYTRNTYTYKVQYLEHGTNEVLAAPKNVAAVYNELVTENAITIEMDMDGDGTNEDFQLYEATSPVQTATITDNSTVITFYYVRCTQDLSVTKTVTGAGADPNQSFNFKLTSQARDFGGANTVYSYQIDDGKQEQIFASDRELSFSLKAGQKITFFDLPTAKYTVTEQALPTGYYCNVPSKTVTLTKDQAQTVTVTNTYEPANLTIKKTVHVEEEDNNTPEVTDFQFTITFPIAVIPKASYSYTVKDAAGNVVTDKDGNEIWTTSVTGRQMSIKLQKGWTATFLNLPVGQYSVMETDYSAYGYDSNYMVTGMEKFTEGETAPVTLVRGTTKDVEFMNKFPVGDLDIIKTVTKEFSGTEWEGDTFTFTVKRTNRPLREGNRYKVLVDGVEQSAQAVVGEDGNLDVTITFTEKDAARLNAAGTSLKLTIKNLPTGTYSVTEAVDTDYVQTPVTPDGLMVSGLVIPAETTPQAEFANKLKRKSGDLYLKKELVAASGFPYDKLPVGQKFSFTIELLEGVPTDNPSFTVSYSSEKYTNDGPDPATSVTMTGGKFTVILEKDWDVTVYGLPEGRYRITEATIPSYANAFAHMVNGSWVEQSGMSTTEGQMYTEIEVEPAATAKVKCTNTYPVSRAELIIQKLVTKEYDRDTLPNVSFAFTVTLDNADVANYPYVVYDKNGKVGDRTAVVSNKAFTVILEAGQYAVIPGMPVCGYTVSEAVKTDDHSEAVSTADYNVSYEVYVSETGETASTTVNTTGTASQSDTAASFKRTFSAGKTDAVVFTNQYKRHLGSLTITKTVEGTTEQDTFIFHVTGNGVDMDVTITGSGSVTVYDLPLGTYTVTEDTSWSWRYLADKTQDTADLTMEQPTAGVAFKNTHNENRWLTIDTVMRNTFEIKN